MRTALANLWGWGGAGETKCGIFPWRLQSPKTPPGSRMAVLCNRTRGEKGARHGHGISLWRERHDFLCLPESIAPQWRPTNDYFLEGKKENIKNYMFSSNFICYTVTCVIIYNALINTAVDTFILLTMSQVHDFGGVNKHLCLFVLMKCSCLKGEVYSPIFGNVV